jgi:nicotinamidase-related amidase
MTSEPIRDPLTDPLLTPTNSALVIIDYQPSQIQTVTSMDSELLVRNIVSVARTAKTYGLPRIEPALSESSKLERSRSAGCRSSSDRCDPPGGDMIAGHRWRPRPLAIAGLLAASTTN